ncbi:MAG: protein-L-isoaspartate O-methyltransferase, partial [Candidatus Marinimicrobia bacterium]|nr:protein-L-isoaspartate O-methyltransferase [Candidatus Neomarinimicrobiota bacterium]
QTISQPYITAYMTELLQTEPDHRVLEIGTGSGYQAALLATLCKEVYSVEIIAAHSIRARKTLEDLQFKNVHLRLGDGRDGWPDAAPFDRILVTAAAKKKIPDALVDQLAEGGRMILPLGNTVHSQKLVVCARMKNQIIEEEDLAVRFVPLVTAGLTHLPKRLATS